MTVAVAVRDRVFVDGKWEPTIEDALPVEVMNCSDDDVVAIVHQCRGR